jgi:hypothetical protein
LDWLSSREEEEEEGEQGSEAREERRGDEVVTELNMGDCCVSMADGGDERLEGRRGEVRQLSRDVIHESVD